MKRLNHPNIVRYLGSQVVENYMYIFMEYGYHWGMILLHECRFVPGGSIRALLQKFGALSENNIRIYTKQILHGLQYLHDNDVIHRYDDGGAVLTVDRDIKGANILVGTNGTVKLADFGCAKMLAGLHSVKSVLGTPYWMAPEVIRGEGYGTSCDIWSLGCTIIEMASVRPPWALEFPEPAAAMFHIGHKSSQETPTISEHLSPEAHDFLIRCFKRDAKERPDAAILLNHAFIRHGHTVDTFVPNPQASPKEIEYLTNSVSMVNATGFSSLPADVIMNIFSFLEDKTLVKVALVCKAWKILTEDDMLWKFKTYKYWKKTRKTDDVTWRSLYSKQANHEKNWIKGELTMRVLKGKGHSKCVNAVLFNDTTLATASDDKKIKIWELPKGKFTKTLKGHSAAVTCLSFLDNSYFQLFSGSADNTIKLWDIKNKRCLKTVVAHSDELTALQCRGNRLVSASMDKTIKLWDISTGSIELETV